MAHKKTISPTAQSIEAVCPSCRQPGLFELTGVQKVPATVAEKLGFDSIRLWTCPHCGSTISEQDLLDAVS